MVEPPPQRGGEPVEDAHSGSADFSETHGTHASAASQGRNSPTGMRTVLRRGAKAALARWVLQRRQQHDYSGAQWPAPQDEATHPWDGRRRFAEDYTFVAVQPRLAIVLRLEWLPGRESHRVWATILRDGGVASSGEVLALAGGQRVQRDERGDRWRAGGMAIDCTTPLSSWTLRFAGRVESRGSGAALRCSVDLSFVGQGSTFTPGRDDDPDLIARRLGEATWDAQLLRSVRRVQNRGYVQLGSIEGTLALGDEIVPIRAAAWRQHAWGVRDWGAADEAFQCFFVQDDGTRGWIHRARFPFVVLEGGFVERDARREPIREIAATFERRADRAPARASLGMRTSGSAPLDVQLEMRSDLAFVVDGRGLVELGLCRTDRGWGVWGGQRRVLPRRA